MTVSNALHDRTASHTITFEELASILQTTERVDLTEALAETFHSRLDLEEGEDLREREEALISAIVDFDDERDPLTAIDYVIGFLLDARDVIAERNGVTGSTLVFPTAPLAMRPNYDLVDAHQLATKARDLASMCATASEVRNNVADAIRAFNDGEGSIDAIQCLDRITMVIEGDEDAALARANALAQAAFYRAFAAQGVVPDVGSNGPWDATNVIVAGLRKLGADADAKALLAYMLDLHGFAGTNGIYDYRGGNQRGQGLTSIVIVQWNAAKKGVVTVSEPGGKPLY
jgi:hypothetical protein